MNKKRIFLTSSSELEHDRREFELFINRKNHDWVSKGVFLELVVWEDFLDAISQTRLQDEYSYAVRNCDIFIMLLWTKVGRYMEEEFEAAIGQFKATQRPFIFTYFKDAEISIESAAKKDLTTLWEFQEKLKTLGHYSTLYKHVDELKFKFNHQLDKLAASGFIEFNPDKEQSAPAGVERDNSKIRRLRIAPAFDADSKSELAVEFRDELLGQADQFLIEFRKSFDITAIPEESQVSANMRMFGLQQARPDGNPWTWATFSKAISDRYNASWIAELNQACVALVSGRTPKVKSLYLSLESGKAYQTAVYRSKYLNVTEGVIDCTIVFILLDVPFAERISIIDSSSVFVITAFRPEAEVIFEGISAAATECSLVAKRVKDRIGDYRITNTVLDMIREARFVICDLTFERPNVYFELGFARGIGKTVIMVAREKTNIHFDVKDWTCIFYSDSRDLEKELRRTLKFLMGQSDG